jgi:hypothetical protein
MSSTRGVSDHEGYVGGRKDKRRSGGTRLGLWPFIGVSLYGKYSSGNSPEKRNLLERDDRSRGRSRNHDDVNGLLDGWAGESSARESTEFAQESELVGEKGA